MIAANSHEVPIKSGPVRLVEQARTVAGWLADKGFHHEAQIVRDLCNSNARYRATLSQLHADNMTLRDATRGEQ